MPSGAENTKPDDALGELSSIDLAVLDYLGEKDPAIALLLEGDWGSGKTHYLDTRGARLAARRDKEFILLSVAGLNTREELEQALFFAASPFFENGYIGALGVFARAGLRWAKVEPKDLQPKPNLSPGTVVVAIDDAERFSGGYKVLLGFVIDLVDKHRVHVVLAASEQKALRESPGFGEWKEKIVGRTLHFTPEPAFIVEATIAELADRVAAKRLERFAWLLEKIVAAWGMKNIRAAKHALKDVARFVAALGDSFDQIGNKAEALVGGLFVATLEIKRDSTRSAEIAKIFSRSDLGVAYQAHLFAEEGDEPEMQGSTFKEIFERYEETPLVEFPGSGAFGKFLLDGVIDVAGVLASLQRVKAEDQDLEALLADYRLMSQTEFERIAGETIAALKSCKIKSLDYIAKLFVVLLQLADRRLIALTSDEVRVLCIQSIEGVEARSVEDPFGDDEIFWYLPHGEGHPEIKAAIAAKRVAARAQITADKRDAFWESIGPNANGLLDGLQEWNTIPLFVGDPERIANGIRSLTPLQLQNFVRFFGARRKFSGYAESLAEEKGVLLAVADSLGQAIPTKGVLTLAQSQLQVVSSALLAFSKSLK